MSALLIGTELVEQASRTGEQPLDSAGPGERLAERHPEPLKRATDSQDLMDHGQDARKWLPEG